MEMDIESLVRKNIKEMKAYSSARSEYSKGNTDNIYLDANENGFGSPLPVNYNRYPDPLQTALKEKIGRIKNITPEKIFLGNGSDEAIDLLFRVFCSPGKDNVIIFPPTYGMYEVCAAVNEVEVKKVSLTPGFQLDKNAIETALDANTRIVFICSPNNPTGNTIEEKDMQWMLDHFKGIVVIDEAYIDYADGSSMLGKLDQFPNLVILQTFSKAWGLAGLRLGMAFAAEKIIHYFNKIKYPYNINTSTQQFVIEALSNQAGMHHWVTTTKEQRESLKEKLETLSFVKKVYPSQANFLLVKMENARMVYDYLVNKKIIVRDRSNVTLCEDCLRITIGTPAENNKLTDTLINYLP